MDKFFGRRYPTVAYAEATCVATPVGESCPHCNEPIAADDDGWLMFNMVGENEREWRPLPYHRACFMRSFIGSVAHQERRCLCYGGTGEDDPTLTRRQAAEAALNYFLTHPSS